MNTGMINSGVLITGNLVHAEEVSYTETGDIGIDLDRMLDSDDGYMDNIHDQGGVVGLRNQYGADFVVLLVDCDCGGVGYYTLDGDFAYNVTDID